MNFSEIEIPLNVIDFLKENKLESKSLAHTNRFLENTCGIAHFFDSDEHLIEFNELILQDVNLVNDPERREYGDFQTNSSLAFRSVEYILSGTANKEFDFILEPTCGKGSFIIAALEAIPGIKKLVGIEIYQPYVWETKFKVLEFFIKNNRRSVPNIEIIHANVFNYNFGKLSKETKQLKTLVIGNPPWVTNSELGAIASKNLPEKSNFKNHRGLDAITGKGNFDIGEYIALMMLRSFCTHDGYFGFLIKSSVVKNLIFDQKNNRFSIGNIEKLNIDAKKEFNVSVDACFFVSELNHKPELYCSEMDFYSKNIQTVFGWTKNSFVYSMDDYRKANNIDGKSQFIWRQGIKHDCSKIMEIERHNGHFRNGLNQEFEIENDLVYGLLKSSDLKSAKTNTYRKLTIVTQKKIGQDTSYIKKKCPQTYGYLDKNRVYFNRRKSSIYRGKPEFSIFGVGDYSFAPYKIAISGMYKNTRFTLVLPEEGKPLMLDDTCYFIGFDNLAYAETALYLLNHEHTQQFLKAIVFPDSKRSVTKEILMRLDFLKIYRLFDINLIQKELGTGIEQWKQFGKLLELNTAHKQMSLF